MKGYFVPHKFCVTNAVVVDATVTVVFAVVVSVVAVVVVVVSVFIIVDVVVVVVVVTQTFRCRTKVFENVLSFLLHCDSFVIEIIERSLYHFIRNGRRFVFTRPLWCSVYWERWERPTAPRGRGLGTKLIRGLGSRVW